LLGSENEPKGREGPVFVFAHQQSADMLIDLGPDTESSYRLLLTCGCGSEFKRWVRADGDGLRFVLLAFENSRPPPLDPRSARGAVVLRRSRVPLAADWLDA